MMKYIMFVNSVSGIGGAELYINRKITYIKKNNFIPYIIAADTDDVIYEEIASTKIMSCFDLCFPTNLYSEKKIEQKITEMINFINYHESDEVYLESQQTSPALWAEKLALKIGCVNIVYPLIRFSLNRKIYKDFFLKKLKKNELLGYHYTYIKKNFGDEYDGEYINLPFDRNEIEGNKNTFKPKKEYDLSILTISRIEKVYLVDTLKDIFEFALENNNLSIRYTMVIDDRNHKNYKKIKSYIRVHNLDNLSFNCIGPIVPLNVDIFMNHDLYFGMGTTTLNAASLGLPSLVVDFRNSNCYGFFGYDFYEIGASNFVAERSLLYYLNWYSSHNEIRKELSFAAEKLYNDEFNSDIVNEKFMNFLEKSKSLLNGYIDIRYKLYDYIDVIDYILLLLFNPKRAYNLRKLLINSNRIFLKYIK